MSALESPSLYNVGFKKQIYLVPGLWGKKGELGLCLQLFPCPGEEGRAMGRAFGQDLFMKSQPPALSTWTQPVRGVRSALCRHWFRVVQQLGSHLDLS